MNEQDADEFAALRIAFLVMAVILGLTFLCGAFTVQENMSNSIKWNPVRSKNDWPQEDGFYWVTDDEGNVFQCHFFISDRCWNGGARVVAWAEIVRPHPYQKPIVVEPFDADDQRVRAVGGYEWKCVNCGRLSNGDARSGGDCTPMTNHNFQRF